MRLLVISCMLLSFGMATPLGDAQECLIDFNVQSCQKLFIDIFHWIKNIVYKIRDLINSSYIPKIKSVIVKLIGDIGKIVAGRSHHERSLRGDAAARSYGASTAKRAAVEFLDEAARSYGAPVARGAEETEGSFQDFLD